MEEVRNCYVYGWFNNDWRVYFYVGRGRGKRYKDISSRSKAFNAVINRFDCEPVILADGLTVEEAEQIEDERKHHLMN